MKVKKIKPLIINRKITTFYLLLLFWVFFASFFVLEVFLRFLGYRNFTPNVYLNEHPTMIYDSSLGWKNQPGEYIFGKYNEVDPGPTFNFLADGRRKTSIYPIKTDKKILVIGCSYTQGWAISNNETYSWRLQELLKSKGVEVLNYGVGGYGTYQSLLMLKEINKTLKVSPELIIYGFYDHHDERNVATLDWMYSLNKSASRNHIYVPYVNLDEHDNLIYNKPSKLTTFFGRNIFVSVYSIEKLILRFFYKNRRDDKITVTKKLIYEMNNFVEKEMNSKLLIVNLQKSQNYDYEKALKDSISFLDARTSNTNKRGWFVEGDGHPNQRMNNYWAEVIYESIK